MSKCKQCGVSVNDPSTVCPLCSCVLVEGGAQHNTYPEIWLKERRFTTLCRIFLFTVLTSSTILIWLNAALYPQYPWCVYPVSGLVYAYLILRCGFSSRIGYRVKIVVLLLFGLALLILVDYVVGFYGWSMNYAIPGSILAADATIVILMLVNVRNWQSYIMFQIGTVLASILPLPLWKYGLITHPLVSEIAFAVSLLALLASLIIGFRQARVELRRRFHL